MPNKKPYVETVKKLLVTLLVLSGLNACNSTAKKEKKPAIETSRDEGSETSSLPPYMEEGKKVYNQQCLACHQSNGEGVPGLNPPLGGTPYVLGDKNRLLDILVNGSDVGLEVDGTTYANAMPAFGALGTKDISDVASYIRNSFGNAASPITEAEVATFRTTTLK